MKLKGIEASNYKGIDQVDVEFSDGHTRIIGLNGSGKTSLFSIIQACLKGVSQKSSKGELVGERFRFIGPHKATSSLKVTFRDEKRDCDVTVVNKMSKASNAIEFKSSDGSTLDRAWLNEFFNVAFLSAKNFINHTPKEQALLLGINTSKFDAEISELKSEYAVINKNIKNMGHVEPMDGVARVDVRALYEERDQIIEYNSTQEERAAEIARYVRAVDDQSSRIAAIKASLKKEEEDLDRLRFVLDKELPKPETEKKLELTSINQQIEASDETNRSAEAYERNEEKRTALAKKSAELEKNKAGQSKVNVKRTAYIKEFDFKSDGLSVDIEGGLLLNDRRLNEFSKGEQEVIVAGLYASLDPSLKVRVIDEFQCLDDTNQKKIVDGLIDKGFQVITLEVGDKKKDKDTILLRECKVVGEDIEKKAIKPKLI